MSLRWWNTLAKNVAEPIFFEVVENLDTRMCMNYGFYREYRYCQCRTVSLCIKEWSRLADREESGKCPHGACVQQYLQMFIFLFCMDETRDG